MKEEKTCFIIMPITTPDDYVSLYKGDSLHFIHVLEHLFVPAIEQAGLKPIKPITKGAENIQASIIENLEKADLVLCDITIHNPNVFFELGIRTALNKPVSIVRDNLTSKIPFDTNTINNHTYNSDVFPWFLPDEIKKLKVHLEECLKKNYNTLWKYFGLTKIGVPEKSGDLGEKIDLILKEITSRNNKISEVENFTKKPEVVYLYEIMAEGTRANVEVFISILENYIKVKSYQLLSTKNKNVFHIDLLLYEEVIRTFLYSIANENGIIIKSINEGRMFDI